MYDSIHLSYSGIQTKCPCVLCPRDIWTEIFLYYFVTSVPLLRYKV